ncbi:ribonuclease H-like domain-containing protein [Mycena crocata]|nr:ribonuclease H-like domain-containing protein [Mycena crocata]
MAPENPIWEMFWRDTKRYKTDRHHDGAWCKACLQTCEKILRQEEIVLVARGGDLPPVRTAKVWEDLACTRAELICGKTETMIVERDRIVQLSDAATQAVKRSRSRSSAQASSSTHPPPASDYRFIYVPPQSPRFTHSTAPSPLSQHGPLSPLDDFTMLPPLDGSYSPSPALSPSPSLSFSDSPGLKRRRTGTSYTPVPPVWTAETQTEFGEDLCKLFATCGWSWNSANNPELKIFFNKYIPSAVVPDRRVLSGSILTTEANKVIAATRQKIEGKLATYSEDGWKNVAHTHVDTSMLSVEGQPYLLRMHDMTGRLKTGDELFEIMKSDFDYAWNTYKVEIIAVCTDDGPDGKKARRLVVAWRPSITVFECWAHQSSLITGNYLAIKAPWMEDVKRAMVVVKWFNNHGKALDLLRAQQMAILLVVLALILPDITRWTVHYCCLRRVKKLERPIRACVIMHEEILRVCAGTKDEQILAAEEVIRICKRDSFWTNIARVANHLEPLAIASNILQSPHCRLDTVLLTLANLFRMFNNLAVSDVIVKRALHASLEQRWGKTDQQLMILGVFFNPYLRARCFNRDALSPNARLLGQTAAGDIEFLNTFCAYYDETGDFSAESMWLDGYAQSYKEAKQPIDLVCIWKQFAGTTQTGRSGFIHLAIRILSILPNSAGPERVFSVFGITHTKHRNRLEPQKVHDATTVRMDRQKLMQQLDCLADDEAAATVSPNVTAEVPADFNNMAELLINLANEEDSDDDDDQIDIPNAPIPIPLVPTAAETVTSATARIPAYKKITLANLFKYPSKESPAGEFEFFWQGGRDSLDTEEEALGGEKNSDAATNNGGVGGDVNTQNEAMETA